MSKALLVEAVAASMGTTKVEAEKAVNAVTNAIRDVVKADNAVQLPNLGKFQMKTRMGRMGRNPMTGTPVEIPAKTFIAFKAAKGV